MKPTGTGKSGKGGKSTTRKRTATRTKPLVRQSLADARRWRALSQTDLAGLTGLDATTISRIERGIHSPYPQNKRKLATALKMDVNEIDWP